MVTGVPRSARPLGMGMLILTAILVQASLALGIHALLTHHSVQSGSEPAAESSQARSPSVAVLGIATTVPAGLQPLTLPAAQPVSIVRPTPVLATPPNVVLLDRGGPVQTRPHIFVFFMGPAWLEHNSLTQSSISTALAFFQSLPASAYGQHLQQYNGAGASPQLRGAWIDPTTTSPQVNPQGDAVRLLAAAQIPTGIASQIVLIYPAGYLFSTPIESNLVGFHSSAAGTPFSAVSYDATTANSLSITLSHEYAETVTNPFSDNEAYVAAGASKDSPYIEIADACQTQNPDVLTSLNTAPYFDAATHTCIAPSQVSAAR